MITDDGSDFYPEQNLDHHRDHVQDWLWKKDSSVAKYYKNVMHFDGWRFDYVKGYEPWVIKDWMDAVNWGGRTRSRSTRRGVSCTPRCGAPRPGRFLRA